MTVVSHFRALLELFGHYVAVIRMTWRRRDDELPLTRHSEDAEFLPAALALQHRAVSPLPRVLAGMLIALISFFFLWAIFGKLDIVAVAEGKIIPAEGAKLVQPLSAGTVKAIYVRDGQRVREGEVVVELDDATTIAESERIAAEITTRLATIAKAQALLHAIEVQRPPVMVRSLDTGWATWDDAEKLARADYDAFVGKMDALDAEIARRVAERSAILALIRTLEQTVPIARRRADALRDLAKDNYVSRTAYLERESHSIEQAGNLTVQRNRLIETDTQLRQAKATKEAGLAEIRQRNLEQISENRRMLLALEQEQVKAREATRMTRLLAPVSGAVQQVAIHTVGGVVTPAQQLMVVVPYQSTLLIDAYLRNQDIGFVRVGQQAEIKLSAFPFTRHGVLTGKVESISGDAIHDEKRGLLYAVRVSLDKSAIDVDDMAVNLSPGLESKVEIRTGERRIIEYFIDPFMHYQSESVRER